KVDVLTRIPALEFERLKASGRLMSFPMIATYFLAFDIRKSPFNDVRWRRRFSAAIDRAGIVQTWGSSETPAWSWIRRGLEGASEAKELPAALLGAQKDSDAQMGSTLPPVGLTFDASGRNSLIVEKVQS